MRHLDGDLFHNKEYYFTTYECEEKKEGGDSERIFSDSAYFIQISIMMMR